MGPLDIKVFPIHESPGNIVARVHSRLKTGLLRAFKEHGHDLTAEQWAMLSCLWETDGLKQVEIAQRLGKDRPTVARMLDLLQKSGYVTRQPDPTDRRSHNIHLTPQGNKLRTELTSITLGVLEHAFVGFSPDQYQVLLELLLKLIANLEADSPPKGGA